LLSVIGLQMIEAPGCGEISVKDHAIIIHLPVSTILNLQLELMSRTQIQNQLQMIESLNMVGNARRDQMIIAMIVIASGLGLLMTQRNGSLMMLHVDAN